MKLSERVTISPDVLTRTLVEETVLLDLASGSYFGLDPVGARIWELLGEGHTLDEICGIMVKEYAVAREELERDVLALLRDLEERGLVSRG